MNTEKLATYLSVLHDAEAALAAGLRTVAEGHAGDHDVYHLNHSLAGWSDRHLQLMVSLRDRYGEGRAEDRRAMRVPSIEEARPDSLGLVRDLQDLHLIATYVERAWQLVSEAGQGLRDRELIEIAETCHSDSERQIAWLKTRMQSAAPEALLT